MVDIEKQEAEAAVPLPSKEVKPNGAGGGHKPPASILGIADEDGPKKDHPNIDGRDSVFTNLKEHMLDPDDDQPPTEELLVSVPIRKPSKKEFVRAHPSYRFTALIWEDDSSRDTYYIHPCVRQAFLEAEGCKKVHLALLCTRRGTLFFWPVTTSTMGDWQQTAMVALEKAQDYWVKILSDMELGGYRVLRATADYGEPNWHDYSLEELLEIAFRGRVIKDLDHPIARAALGR